MNREEWTKSRVEEIRKNNLRELHAERRRCAEHKAPPPKDDGQPKKVLGILKNEKFEDWSRVADIFGFKV